MAFCWGLRTCVVDELWVLVTWNRLGFRIGGLGYDEHCGPLLEVFLLESQMLMLLTHASICKELIIKILILVSIGARDASLCEAHLANSKLPVSKAAQETLSYKDLGLGVIPNIFLLPCSLHPCSNAA